MDNNNNNIYIYYIIIIISGSTGSQQIVFGILRYNEIVWSSKMNQFGCNTSRRSMIHLVTSLGNSCIESETIEDECNEYLIYGCVGFVVWDGKVDSLF